ncbi:alpha/beta hydrolase [Flexistipes sp.]|uniref:alpha/beta hydrolase n=1 Tax=Flexistipes sp. TaxID=3088135 RepID=UPI002E1AB3ED|nr:alpha/beta fold hydrolase [Flexistipes sp.]
MNIYTNKKKTIFRWFILPWIIGLLLIFLAVGLVTDMDKKLKPFVALDNVSSEELYQLDLKRSYAEGVRLDENLPLYTEGTDNSVGILLIHGFTGSPYEMHELSAYLNSLGYTTYSVRLPGSGTTPENLNEFSYADWYESLKFGYFALKNSCNQVYVAGQSLGGLLASAVGYYNEVSGIIMLNPAFKIKDWRFQFIPLMQLFNSISKKSDFDANYAGYFYDVWPLKGMYQLYLTQKYVKKKLHDYDSPVLLVQAIEDEVVDYKGVLRYFEKIKAKDKKKILVEGKEDMHVLTLNKNSKQQFVFEAISNWIKEKSNVQR